MFTCTLYCLNVKIVNNKPKIAFLRLLNLSFKVYCYTFTSINYTITSSSTSFTILNTNFYTHIMRKKQILFLETLNELIPKFESIIVKMEQTPICSKEDLEILREAHMCLTKALLICRHGEEEINETRKFLLKVFEKVATAFLIDAVKGEILGPILELLKQWPSNES